MNSNFRDNADHGVLCALFLPISIGVSNLKFSTQSLSSSSSFYLSTCFALYSLYLANTFRIFPFSATSQRENKVFETTFGSWILVAASAIVQYLLLVPLAHDHRQQSELGSIQTFPEISKKFHFWRRLSCPSKCSALRCKFGQNSSSEN